MHDHAANPANLLSATIRNGHPDFLDLPWGHPLDRWSRHTDRLEDLPHGLSRHPVVFANYDGAVYALKELPESVAGKEFDLLRRMEERRLPAVLAVGHALVRAEQGRVSVLITRYLDRSLPYHALFMRSGLDRYREHLLDALACLLVQLHLAGVYWGDCSLNNTLYRRDAGCLNAYLVDAETAEVHDSVSDGMRGFDLDLMEENLCGGLLDLDAEGALPSDLRPSDVGPYVRSRYEALWAEVTREEVLPVGERYRIQQRVRALNALGFSVDHIELLPTDAGEQVCLRAFVTDRRHHRDLLHSLTGLDPEEMQARIMLNEIQELRAALAAEQNRSTSLSAAAHQWLGQRYLPAVGRLTPLAKQDADATELYCQLLEHKWYLSEQAQHDVGHAVALQDFVDRFAAGD